MSTRTPGDATLGTELAALGAELDWPETPDLALAVGRELRAEGPRTRSRWSGVWRPARRALVLGVVAALLVIGLVAGIGFALGGLKIVFGGPPPGSPLPPELVVARGFGGRTDLGTAAERLGGLLVPTDSALGPPDHVYYDDGTGAVTMAWGARAGLPADPGSGLAVVLTEFRAEITSGTFTKVLYEGALLQRTSVAGHPAYWIAGGEHFFFFRRQNGEPLERTIRMVGTALMWEQDGLTLRIEGVRGMADAIRIGQSMAMQPSP
jgi:hypothetical protein